MHTTKTYCMFCWFKYRFIVGSRSVFHRKTSIQLLCIINAPPPLEPADSTDDVRLFLKLFCSYVILIRLTLGIFDALPHLDATEQSITQENINIIIKQRFMSLNNARSAKFVWKKNSQATFSFEKLSFIVFETIRRNSSCVEPHFGRIRMDALNEIMISNHLCNIRRESTVECRIPHDECFFYFSVFSFIDDILGCIAVVKHQILLKTTFWWSNLNVPVVIHKSSKCMAFERSQNFHCCWYQLNENYFDNFILNKWNEDK